MFPRETNPLSTPLWDTLVSRLCVCYLNTNPNPTAGFRWSRGNHRADPVAYHDCPFTGWRLDWISPRKIVPFGHGWAHYNNAWVRRSRHDLLACDNCIGWWLATPPSNFVPSTFSVDINLSADIRWRELHILERFLPHLIASTKSTILEEVV